MSQDMLRSSETYVSRCMSADAHMCSLTKRAWGVSSVRATAWNAALMQEAASHAPQT